MPLHTASYREGSGSEGMGRAAQGQPEGENIELAQILSGIAQDVGQHCAALCAAISAEFAGRMDFARKTLPRDQAAGAIAALRATLAAALAAVRLNAAMELSARSEMAKRLYGGGRRPAGGQKPPGRAPPRDPQ
jgi:hypothetical protein